MNKSFPKVPLLFLAIVAFLLAMWAGLLRLGWQWAPLRPTLPSVHGPLMISGFLGTLISLERAVALANRFPARWVYLVPTLTGLGGGVLILGGNHLIGIALITLGSLGLTILFGLIARQHAALHTIVMLIGAVCWFVGNGLWLAERPISQVVWWWAAFLVLTIAGERLELSRVTRPSKRSLQLFEGATAVVLLGLTITIWAYDIGVRTTGFGLLLLAVWLLRFDIARKTVHKTGLTRFIATCLLSGYGWLAIGGLLAIIYGGIPAGPYYDAMLHAIFLGFVMTMIFGHAPIIFPAVLGLPVVYRPAFYAHLILLHITLPVRVIADLTLWIPGRQWGGLLNAIVLVLFLLNTVYSIWLGKQIPKLDQSPA